MTLKIDLKINKVYPLVMANLSDKFDKDAHTDLVSIMFTTSIRDNTDQSHRSFIIFPLKCIAQV